MLWVILYRTPCQLTASLHLKTDALKTEKGLCYFLFVSGSLKRENTQHLQLEPPFRWRHQHRADTCVHIGPKHQNRLFSCFPNTNGFHQHAQINFFEEGPNHLLTRADNFISQGSLDDCPKKLHCYKGKASKWPYICMVWFSQMGNLIYIFNDPCLLNIGTISMHWKNKRVLKAIFQSTIGPTKLL